MALRRSFNLFTRKSNARSIYSCTDHADLEQYAKDHGHHGSLFGTHLPHHETHHINRLERFFHTEIRREVTEQAHSTHTTPESEVLTWQKKMSS